VLDDLTMGVILSGLVLGAIGFFMFLYGKRESQPLTLIAGLVLGILPMATHDVLLMWVVGGAVVGGVVLHRRNAETTAVA
jgi:hypothetical protein